MCNKMISLNENFLNFLLLLLWISLFATISSAPQNYNSQHNPCYPFRCTGYSQQQPSVQRFQYTTTQAPRRSIYSNSRAGQSSSGFTSDFVNSIANLYRPKPSTQTSDSNVKIESDAITDANRVSTSDKDNAKFAGVSNQEDEEDSKTLIHLQRRRFNGLRPYLDPCSGYGRSAEGGKKRQSTAEQGRLLWDLNVYNVYPTNALAVSNVQQSPCGGYSGLGGLLGGGGGLGGGLLSDPIAQSAYLPPAPPLNTFLSLFAPGILQNSLAVTARPQLRPQVQIQSDDPSTDPAVDPAYNQPLPVRRPNRVYYDTAGAAPVTPAQLVGGIATTVNGIIQQLTGNVQPVYPSYRTNRSYG